MRDQGSHLEGVVEAIRSVLTWTGPLSTTDLLPHVRRAMQLDGVFREHVSGAAIIGVDRGWFDYDEKYRLRLSGADLDQPALPPPKVFEGRFYDPGAGYGGWTVTVPHAGGGTDTIGLADKADEFTDYQVRITIEVIGPKQPGY